MAAALMLVGSVVLGAAPVQAQEARLGRPLRVLGVDEPLYRVRDVVFAADQVIVLTAPEPSIQVFDITGRSRSRSWGREGKGPGELENPVAMTVIGDFVHVLDLVPGAPRVVTFTLTGEAVRTTVASGVELGVALSAVDDELIIETAELRGRTRKLVRVAQPDAALLEFVRPEQIQLVSDEGPMQSLRVTPPFAAQPHWTVLQGAGVAFWPGEGQHIAVLPLHGGDTLVIELSKRAYPLTAADQARWIERTFPVDAEVFGIRDAYRGLRKAARERIQFPDAFPPVLRLDSDSRGGLWVLRADRASGQVWTLIEAGIETLTLVGPPGRDLVAFGARMLATTAVDENGVELIEIYERPGGLR